MVHGELAIASGAVAEGLRRIGAATSDPRAGARADEVQRILGLYGIGADEAEAGMAAGRGLDLDSVVEELLAEGARRTSGSSG
jgi:hypothetical protein